MVVKQHLFFLNAIFLFVFLDFVLLYAHSTNLVVGLVSTLSELAVFLLLYLGVIYIPSFFLKPDSKRSRLLSKVYMIFFALHAFLFALDSIYVLDLVEMKYSLSAMNYQMFLFVVKNILKGTSITLAASFVGISFLISWIITRNRTKVFRYFFPATCIIVLALCVVFIPPYYAQTSNFYVSSIAKSATLDATDEIELNLEYVLATSAPEYKHDVSVTNLSPKYKHVFVFVMEQTIYTDFEKNRIESESQFFSRLINKSTYFQNYYTLNQDSRTSIWTMLGGEYIPFEAYIDNWDTNYGAVLGNADMITSFNEMGYKTSITASVFDVGLLLGVYNWSVLLFAQNYNEVEKDYFCVHKYGYQKGCEDNALVAQNFAYLRENQNESTFYFQEFIYGHGADYMRALKMSRSAYYELYLEKFFDHLETLQILDESLVLIVADHGEKGYFLKDIEDYHIPVIAFAPKSLPSQNIDLHSHLDFSQILNHYLFGTELPIPAEELFIFGQSSSSEFAYKSLNSHAIGKIDETTLKIHESSNVSRRDLTQKYLSVLAHQKNLQNKSRSQVYECEYCVAHNERLSAHTD